MRIVNVTMVPLKPDSGLSLYVREVSHRLAAQGHQMTVIGHGNHCDILEHTDSLWQCFPGSTYSNILWQVLPLASGYATRLHADMKGVLRSSIREADVIHLHGMRTKLNAVASELARQASIPVVVSPHGQVHPWLRSQRRARKWLADNLWDRKIFRHASMGLAMSPDEKDHINDYSPGLPTTWIPIGIDSPEPVDESVLNNLTARTPLLTKPLRQLLYLAPLNHRKGYDLLIQSYAKLREANTLLVLAGPDADVTHDQVKLDIAQLGIDVSSVVHLSRMSAAQRDALMKSAWAFVAPSRSENFGIVVLEALAAGVPVLTTTGTPWARLDPSGTVVCVEPTVTALSEGMKLLLSESAAARNSRIEQGVKLAQERFDWYTITRDITSLYCEVVKSYSNGDE